MGVVLKDKLRVMKNNKVPFYTQDEFEDRFTEVEKMDKTNKNKYVKKMSDKVVKIYGKGKILEKEFEKGELMFEFNRDIKKYFKIISNLL